MLLERQEGGAARRLRAGGEHLLGHFDVAAIEAEPAPEFGVGHGLDVEHEAVGARAHGFFIRTATAITRPASSVRLTWPSRGAEAIGHGAAARRKDDFRLAPGVRLEAEVADPHAVAKAGAQRLGDRLLGREAHGEEAHGPARRIEQRPLFGHQQPIDKMLAESPVRGLDALDLHEIGADAEDHGAVGARRA